MSSIMQNAGGDKLMANQPGEAESPLNKPEVRAANATAPSVATTSASQNPPAGTKASPPQEAQSGSAGADVEEERPPTLLQAEAGGAGKRTPGRPIGLDDPEDLPDFLDDLENEGRGAETKKQVWSVEPYIRAGRRQGYPIGRIFLGLSKRGKITVGKTQFEKVCRREFPDLF